MKDLKVVLLFIGGIGISNLGKWIYLVAITLIVLDLTESAAAVAGLYIIGPAARLFTNTWSGSLIDRVNKRKLMIWVDVVRGALIFLLPFVSSLWIIYVLVFAVNIAGSFFGPTSNVYIAQLIPPEERKRFNSSLSFVNSGAFLLGPAIAGVIIMYSSVEVCLLVNAITFMLCAICIYFLPDKDGELDRANSSFSFKTLLHDWTEVYRYLKQAKYFLTIFILFQATILIGFALDSQEATFVTMTLGLGEEAFGLILSIAGAGSLIGSFLAASLTKVFSLRAYLALGTLLSTVGYTLFYAASGLLLAALGVIVLTLFLTFGFAGYTTFFQNQVPTHQMGRVGSMTELVTGSIQIVFTLIFGALAELFSLQLVALILCGFSIVLALVLSVAVFLPSAASKYEEDQNPLAL